MRKKVRHVSNNRNEIKGRLFAVRQTNLLLSLTCVLPAGPTTIPLSRKHKFRFQSAQTLAVAQS